MYKIKKYDTSLDSEIRKYKKSSGIEEYNRIYDIVEKRYRRDINTLVLNSIDSNIVEQISVEEEGILWRISYSKEKTNNTWCI